MSFFQDVQCSKKRELYHVFYIAEDDLIVTVAKDIRHCNYKQLLIKKLQILNRHFLV